MLDLPLALAFTGGLVATVNPCGFAMLPAYLSFFVSLDRDASPTRPKAVVRGLRVGLVVSVGFLLVFAVAGILLSAGAQLVINLIPWVAIVVGVGLALLGGWLLSGRTLAVRIPGPKRGVQGRTPAALLAFGVAYALASLSCTLPVFLTVVAGTLTRGNVASVVVVFGAYAVGMMLPLLVVSVALALGHGAAVRRLRSSSRHANRFAGGLLVVAGAYIVGFWAFSLAGGGATPTVIEAVERWSALLTNMLGTRPLLAGSALAALVVVAAVYAVRSGRRREHPEGTD